MPNKSQKRNSVVDMLSKVPVNRGSLLKGIDNLLKTIESSESSVMIPTLLRDKCEFDAWELLFVAKILKASILGHSDLVEFYMNHIGHSLNQQNSQNGNSNSPIASPSDTAGSLDGSSNGPNGSISLQNQTQTTNSPSFSPANSVSGSLNGLSQTSNTQQSKSLSSASWVTANQASNSLSSAGNSFTSSSTVYESELSNVSSGIEAATETNLSETTQASSQQCSNTKPLMGRLAQPPSLLQLTTTNNHINSVAAVHAGFTNNNIELMSNQLLALQVSNGNGNTTPNGLDGALSITTSATNQQHAGSATTNGTPTSQHPPELRTSRSAGCLFRLNSGASSPRTPAQTPTTPFSQSDNSTNGLANGLQGDVTIPVKLLLQIEQLKLSINHVTNLLESVVELYKNSIDNLA